MSGPRALDEEGTSRAPRTGLLARLRGSGPAVDHAPDVMGRVLECCPAPMMHLDRSGRVIRWNSAAKDLFGWTEDEVRGAQPPIGDRTQRRALKTAIADALKGRPVTGAPFTAARRDGATLELRISATRPGPDLDASQATVIVAFSDLTPYRRLEELHSQFIDMVAHELRTPLASIVGYSVLLRRAELEWDLHLRKRCVEMILNKGRLMDQLIGDLVCALRIQAGSLDVVSSEVDARDIVSESAGGVHGAGRRIQVHLPEDPLIVQWDPELMSRAVRHLVSNAVKFSPKGSTVTVSVDPRPDRLRIDISDEGPGVPIDVQPRVFGRFVQADMSRTRPTGGMGLGLYIADHVVQAHGGRVELTSEPGQGSTFSIEVPSE